MLSQQKCIIIEQNHYRKPIFLSQILKIKMEKGAKKALKINEKSTTKGRKEKGGEGKSTTEGPEMLLRFEMILALNVSQNEFL